MLINLLLGIICTLVGIMFLYKSSLMRRFYSRIQNGKLSDYERTVGVVICDAYHFSDNTEIIKAVTPIVEYEVNGKKYEAQNPILEVGAELPAGTKVYVWYKKNEPHVSVLGTELSSYYLKQFFGIILLCFAFILFLLCF